MACCVLLKIKVMWLLWLLSPCPSASQVLISLASSSVIIVRSNKDQSALVSTKALTLWFPICTSIYRYIGTELLTSLSCWVLHYRSLVFSRNHASLFQHILHGMMLYHMSRAEQYMGSRPFAGFTSLYFLQSLATMIRPACTPPLN